ncbi:unnamed protein product [Nesidiocoris tenuis]|uniref:Uncharacterized protein n=1 Tax=Nesidiocoris tenuis TaxID=355587 RepID=A0A6H5HMK9_9HEMI|nr:unnamed protein product [Nesidiocoris tenuis]
MAFDCWRSTCALHKEDLSFPVHAQPDIATTPHITHSCHQPQQKKTPSSCPPSQLDDCLPSHSQTNHLLFQNPKTPFRHFPFRRSPVTETCPRRGRSSPSVLTWRTLFICTRLTNKKFTSKDIRWCFWEFDKVQHCL